MTGPALQERGSVPTVLFDSVRARLAHARLRRMWRYWVSTLGARRKRNLFAECETFCLFLGHGRSGHSIVGALLDAHPDIIVADEVDVLGDLRAGFTRDQILFLCLKTASDQARQGRLKRGRDGRTYSYAVPGQWQGRTRRGTVIGASKAGMSVHRLTDEPDLADLLARTMHGVRLRFIHVIRNPYDNIATMMIRRDRTFDDAFEEYFADWASLQRLHSQLDPEQICTATHEAILADPRVELVRLCAFLGVTAERDYLDACASILFQSPSQSRHKVNWSDAQRSLIDRRIAEFELLRGYSIDR